MKRVLALLFLLAGCGSGDVDRAAAPGPAENGEIVFASKRDGDFDIYVMRADGSNVRNLTHDSATDATEADDGQPVWSPDGRTIAFLSTRDHRGDGDAAPDVYVMDADGGDVRRLTENDAAERSLDWTRDGRLVFWRCTGGVFGCSLVALSPDGGDEEELFDAGDGLSGLSVSPDGSKVAFNRWDVNAATNDVDVVVADLDGGGERPLTTAPGVDGDPEWSPDGTKLVFASDRDRNGDCFFHDCTGHAPELYVMNADGRGQRRLTDDPGYDVFGTWSPDGKLIVFARLAEENGDYELFVVDASGGPPRPLTDNGEWDWMPDWGATGTR